MNKSETVAILAVISAAWPSRNGQSWVTPEVIDIWSEMFAADDPREVTAAVKGMISTQKFMPTIADVKEAMQKQRALARGDLTAGEAWEKVIKAMHRWGYYQPDKAHEMLGDEIWAVIRQCGGWAVCCDSEMTVISAQFERRYNARKERQAYAEKLPAGLIEGVRELLGVMMIEGGKS